MQKKIRNNSGNRITQSEFCYKQNSAGWIHYRLSRSRLSSIEVVRDRCNLMQISSYRVSFRGPFVLDVSVPAGTSHFLSHERHTPLAAAYRWRTWRTPKIRISHASNRRRRGRHDPIWSRAGTPPRRIRTDDARLTAAHRSIDDRRCFVCDSRKGPKNSR